MIRRLVSDPRAEIERMVGPLAMFEIVGEAKAEEAPKPEAMTLTGRILAALGAGEMARDTLRVKLIKRHAGAGEIAEALAALISAGEIVAETRGTGGRPALCYRLAEPAEAPAIAPSAEDLPFLSISDAVILGRALLVLLYL